MLHTGRNHPVSIPSIHVSTPLLLHLSNPLSEVQRFFEHFHAGKYKLYDLRAESGAAYDAEKFHGRVSKFGFFDHNPAPLALIRECVEDIHAWLGANEGNVVAIHCKAGKGRTGLIIAAYLVYAGLAPSTTAALKIFGDCRTSNGKGVTIPSQMRCAGAAVVYTCMPTMMGLGSHRWGMGLNEPAR